MANKATYSCLVMVLLAIVLCGPARAVGIAISHTLDISFGQVISGTFGGTVTISPAGLRTAIGVAVVPSSLSSQAVFDISGDPDLSYSIILPATVSLNSTSGVMTVDSFTSSPSGSGLLNGGGSDIVQVGATLHLVANQPTGDYSGDMDVTVAYE